jgi:hypothetical protein
LFGERLSVRHRTTLRSPRHYSRCRPWTLCLQAALMKV